VLAHGVGRGAETNCQVGIGAVPVFKEDRPLAHLRQLAGRSYTCRRVRCILASSSAADGSGRYANWRRARSQPSAVNYLFEGFRAETVVRGVRTASPPLAGLRTRYHSALSRVSTTRFRVIQRRAYGLKNEEYFRLKVLTCMLPEL